jgi:hypothetical protein
MFKVQAQRPVNYDCMRPRVTISTCNFNMVTFDRGYLDQHHDEAWEAIRTVKETVRVPIGWVFVIISTYNYETDGQMNCY